MYLVLDTNVILLDAYNLINIAKHSNPQPIVVLPETVLDEIDSKKSGHTEVAYQARLFARLLAKATRLHSVTDDVMNTPLLTTTVLVLDGVTIHICALASYPSFNESEQSIRNDRKILHVTELLNRRYPDLTFCSNDVMCRIRAESLGLKTSDFKIVSDTDPEFTRRITVPSETFASLHGASITAIDDEYKQEYYNYVITDASTGQTKLGYILNGLLYIIDRDLEDTIRKQDAPPINTGQLFLSNSILNPHIDVVICESLSGSGKTMTAISSAMQLVNSRSPYKGIVYIRNTVDDIGERDEEIGFLSGNDEKIKGYLYPFYDTVAAIAKNRLKDSRLKGSELEAKLQEVTDDLISKHSMTAITAMHLRGRTFNDAVVIVDEAQNFSAATMQKLLTRLGKNIKVIVIGSLKQIDSKYLTKYTSGLSVLIGASTKPSETVTLSAVTLEKVVRGPITAWAETLFSKMNK